MFKFNKEVLKRHIRKSVFTTADICELIGLNEQTYYYRMRNDLFTVSDFLNICSLLNLSIEDTLEMIIEERDE